MTPRLRERILRFHAAYLGVAAVAGLLRMDIPAIFFGTGPEAPILEAAPFAGIGFLEAHGLALIIAVLLWKAPSTRLWHVTGFSTGALLGGANLMLWEIFIFTGQLGMGYVATGLHLTAALFELAAAFAVTRSVALRTPASSFTAQA
jgi:hypothetical protein